MVRPFFLSLLAKKMSFFSSFHLFVLLIIVVILAIQVAWVALVAFLCKNLQKLHKKKCFCKVLKISACLKRFKKVLKKLLDLFAGSEICTTFALAFGKQRGNAP